MCWLRWQTINSNIVQLAINFINDTFSGLLSVVVTGPGKTGLIYTKYTSLYYGMYLLCCMCYPESVNFMEFLMEFCIYDDLLDTIQITDKKLLYFKLSKSGQIFRVDKTCFPRPGHNLICNKRPQRVANTISNQNYFHSYSFIGWGVARYLANYTYTKLKDIYLATVPS